jgi:hypothetical protein
MNVWRVIETATSTGWRPSHHPPAELLDHQDETLQVEAWGNLCSCKDPSWPKNNASKTNDITVALLPLVLEVVVFMVMMLNDQHNSVKLRVGRQQQQEHASSAVTLVFESCCEDEDRRPFVEDEEQYHSFAQPPFAIIDAKSSCPAAGAGLMICICTKRSTELVTT